MNKYVESMAYTIEIKRVTTELLSYMLDVNNEDLGITSNSPEYKIIKRFVDEYIPELENLLQESPFLFENEYFISEIRNKLYPVLNRIAIFFKTPVSQSRIYDFINYLAPIHSVLKDIYVAKNAWDNTNQIIDNELRPLISSVQDELLDIKRAKLTLQNDAVYSVFRDYETKLKTEADKWEKRFFQSFGVGVSIIAVITISPFICPRISELNLSIWFLKILFITVTITLSTYFIKRSIHLRKQADQMGQVSFELDALPSFMSSLNNENSQDVTLMLIEKYFGREIDQSQNDKIGDLLQDQVKAGTQLIRASADMVKSTNLKK
ncbi:hypothetical protein [Acinetobacter venetianus]|uniref:hypothetical protein n=1 Tax=Acinetobacter venetianus TaxID=52133 RepID=UPI00289C364B|nr:hypothetical protein [Acinetobacter venetianus]